MGAPLDPARLHGQHRGGAVQVLDLGLLVDAQHHGVVRGARRRPTTSVTLPTSSGSVEYLKVPDLQGWIP
ncbi:hypothetical protein [Actinomyces gerencseriae]|uniref:hypothetical protein n=1 Tax=Actinomyces gerencseriae TaxID=52769 RepID=UPI003CCC1E83